MNRPLDIGPLRSLVAVADCGGFQRAADRLHLSQAGVSQHVRRLEAAVGRTLVERAGRGSRFTADGEQLLASARRILAAHDEAVRAFRPAERLLTVGSTEHAAARLLPLLSSALERNTPTTALRYRIDRGAHLRTGLASGDIDLALLLDAPGQPGAVHVGDLELTWCTAPGWEAPAPPRPLPLVAFRRPCELRKRALETLDRHAVPAAVNVEANQLAGVLAAVGAALLAFPAAPPGMVTPGSLPPATPLPLHLCPRVGLDEDVVRSAAAAVRSSLTDDGVADIA